MPRNIPFMLIYAKQMHFDILESLIKKTLFGSCINKRIRLLLVYYPVKLMIQCIAFVLIQRLTRFFNYRICLWNIKPNSI